MSRNNIKQERSVWPLSAVGVKQQLLAYSKSLKPEGEVSVVDGAFFKRMQAPRVGELLLLRPMQ